MTARGSDTLTYDARNRLIKMVKDSNDIEFGYSADGARLYKKFNSTVTQIWIGDFYEEKDDKILCHVYAGDKLVTLCLKYFFLGKGWLLGIICQPYPLYPLVFLSFSLPYLLLSLRPGQHRPDKRLRLVPE